MSVNTSVLQSVTGIGPVPHLIRLFRGASITKLLVALLFLGNTLLLSSCGTKSSDPAPSGSGQQTLGFQMAAGGQSISQGGNVDLRLTVVDANGNIINAPASVTYSVEPSGLGTVVNGSFVAGSTTGTGVVTATMSYNGATYTTQIPVVVVAPASQFHVVPSAVVWGTGLGTIQLETVYFGTSAPGAITYSSANTSVVTVSNTGEISFVGNGSTKITVRTTIQGQAKEVEVPVLVVGPPAAPLPVARVTCTPNPVTLFRGETQQLSPKAFNGAGADVTAANTFTYEIINKDSSDDAPQPCISVSTTGLVTPLRSGTATIIVTSRGVSTQVEVEVLPDKVILNDPFFASLGLDITDPFNPRQVNEVTVTARTYNVNKVAYRARDYNNAFTLTTNPGGLRWFKPTTGIPQIDQFFDIVDLLNPTTTNVLVRKKSSGTAVGSTFVIAYDPADLTWTEPGVTAVNVTP